jgi:hypothetical protein
MAQRMSADAAVDDRSRVQGAANPFTALAVRARSTGGVARGALAFLVYLGVSVAVFAGSTIGDLATRCVGSCLSDTNLYIWSFGWMDHAVTTRVDPLFSDVVWAPGGIHLAWVTSLPGPALLMQPFTHRFGGLFSVNVLMILAPALAAWATYLVANRVTRRFWASVVAGAVFGFSTYINQHERAQLNLILVFFIPLGVYLVLRWMDRSLGTIAFVVLLGLTLAGLFSTSTEVFATATLMLAVTLLGAIILVPRGTRTRVLACAGWIAASYGVAALLVSPILLRLGSDAPTGEPIRPADLNSVDLLSFVVPPPIARFGGSTFAGLSNRFPAYPQNDTAYIGILFLVVIWFMVEFRKRWWAWFLLGCVLGAAVLSLGPVLHIAGRGSITMPGRWLLDVPLIRHATADRLPLYLFLPIAVMCAAWLAAGKGRWRALRYALVVSGVVLMSIDLAAEPHYHGTIAVPAFFEDGSYHRFVEPGDVVLAIPSQIGGDMVWQAAAGMDLRLGRAYVGPVHPMGSDALGLRVILSGADAGALPPADVVRRFISGRDVRAVFAEEPVGDDVRALMDDVLGGPPVSVDGVSVWVVPASGPTPLDHPA